MEVLFGLGHKLGYTEQDLLNKRQEEKETIEKEKQRKRNMKIAIIGTPIMLIAFILINFVLPHLKYNKAIGLRDTGDYARAIAMFAELGDYKDSEDKLLETLKESDIDIKSTVSVGQKHTVGLKADGTVVAVGRNTDGQCDVQDWQDIVAVSAGANHTAGLKADGTVVAVGRNGFSQCDVQDWQDIVAVSAGQQHTVGLKADGTVVAVGSNDLGQCDVQDWIDIKVVERRHL